MLRCLAYSGDRPHAKKHAESYAQLVNADSKRVGCAASIYLDGPKFKRVAVCNYGNGVVLGVPLYAPGQPCYGAKECDDGLVVA